MTILIVGGGKMGMSHLSLVSQYVGKSNVVLCDSKRSTRWLFGWFGYRTFATVDAAAQAIPDIQGVLVATPTSSHAALAKWAIERRIPVFVEKPLTLDVGRSQELVDLAAAAQVPAQVGFVLRYLASFQRLRELVADGRLGQLRSYVASMRGNVVTAPLAADSWQGDFARGGGCLNEYGPHIIDLCNFIFGPVSSVERVEMASVFSSRADDRVQVDWQHGDKLAGRLDIDWCDTTKRKSVIEFRAVFDHAEVRVDNSALDIHWNDLCPLTAEVRQQIDRPVQAPNVGYYLRGEEFSLEIEAFLAQCLRRPVHVDATVPTDITARLQDGYEVDRLIDEIARKAGLK